MAGDHEKVRSIQAFITKDLHDAFVKKAIAEGWSIQQAVSRLILRYVNEDEENKVT